MSLDYPEVFDPGPEDNPTIPDTFRKVRLTPASAIKPRPVWWLWEGRIAKGTFSLLAGREGLGKSTMAYWIAARLTRGELPGEYLGEPKAVLICATEDSWAQTIVPRLIAAGADRDLIYRVDVETDHSLYPEALSLPRDVSALASIAVEHEAVLLLLDPLISRLGDLDTHRDSEVRQALEPLAALADRVGMAVLGLIHHNKSGTTDPLSLVMGSKAFTAVARSVHTVVPDPDDDDDTRRLFGTPKNNLGRTNLPTLTFVVEGHAVPTEEGMAWTGKVVFGEHSTLRIGDALSTSGDGSDRSAAAEAAAWLEDYLASQGGQAASADVKKAGKGSGHSEKSLHAARKRLRLETSSSGFPRQTYWELPVMPIASRSLRAGGEGTTDMTDSQEGDAPPLTCDDDSRSSHAPVVSVVSSRASHAGTPRARDTTGLTPLPLALCHLHPDTPKPDSCFTCEQIGDPA